MSSPRQDAANRCEQIRETLRNADQLWRSFESRLAEKEEDVLWGNLQALRGWFGLDEAELSNWTDGGLRCKVRGRVQKLVLVPFFERMREHVGCDCHANVKGLAELETSGGKHIVDALLERWEIEVEPLMSEATRASEELSRRTRKMANGSSLEARELPGIWVSAANALESIVAPVKRLAAFLEAEASSEAVSRLLAVVPAVVGRAACDWYFQRCVAELEQLEGWWDSARAALKRQGGVWEDLLEQEGLFVRRLERGIQDLHSERQRYALFATFGASKVEPANAKPEEDSSINEWPETAMALAAQTVKVMRRTLKPIRDSAAWRVSDVAKEIQKRFQRNACRMSRARTPWERTSRVYGIKALCEALGASYPKDEELQLVPGALIIGGSDPMESALVFAHRLDRLAAVTGDLNGFLASEPDYDVGGITYILEEILQAFTYMNEELLSVMDDPTQASIQAWSQQWCMCGESIDANRLQSAMSAMPSKVDSKMSGGEGRSVDNHLALMRGLHELLTNRGLRAWTLRATACKAGTQDPLVLESFPVSKVIDVSPGEDESDLDLVSALPLGAPVPATSPRIHYPQRQPERKLQPPEAESSEPIGPSIGPECEARGLLPLPRSEASGGYPSLQPTPAIVQPPEAITFVPHSPSSTATSPRKVRTRPVRGSCENIPEAPLTTEEAYAPLAQDITPPSCIAAVPASTETVKLDARPRRSTSGGNNSLRPETPSDTSWTRPSTPSWLVPPWPRMSTPSTPFGRPDTPSTACDEEDLVQTPKWKFVDGQCIPKRVSSLTRLPPIRLTTSRGF